MPEFPLDLKNNVILLDVLFEGPRDGRILKMVLDTGASITTIPYETAIAIGIDPTRSQKRVEIITASAKEYTPSIIIPKLSLLGFSLKNVEAICLDLPPTNSRASGLLGLNILKNFNVFLKFRSKILEIES